MKNGIFCFHVLTLHYLPLLQSFDHCGSLMVLPLWANAPLKVFIFDGYNYYPTKQNLLYFICLIFTIKFPQSPLGTGSLVSVNSPRPNICLMRLLRQLSHLLLSIVGYLTTGSMTLFFCLWLIARPGNASYWEIVCLRFFMLICIIEWWN